MIHLIRRTHTIHNTCIHHACIVHIRHTFNTRIHSFFFSSSFLLPLYYHSSIHSLTLLLSLSHSLTLIIHSLTITHSFTHSLMIHSCIHTVVPPFRPPTIGSILSILGAWRNWNTSPLEFILYISVHVRVESEWLRVRVSDRVRVRVSERVRESEREWEWVREWESESEWESEWECKCHWTYCVIRY